MAWADHAATRIDRAEEHASHLKGIVRDMMSMLSMHFRVMGFKNMLAHISTLAPAPTSGDDDDNIDLGDF